MSIQGSLCFAHMIKPHINLEGDIPDLVKPRKGIKIKLFGFSELT